MNLICYCFDSTSHLNGVVVEENKKSNAWLEVERGGNDLTKAELGAVMIGNVERSLSGGETDAWVVTLRTAGTGAGDESNRNSKAD